MRDTLTRDVTAAVRGVPGVTDLRLQLGVMTDEQRSALRDSLRGGATKDIPFARPDSLTRVYAIASGKGGVGKSTVTVNLAAALAGRGLSVGVVDADIYGFSIPRMLGVTRPADPGRRHDPAAGGARGEGDQRRHVRRGQHPGGVARADAAPGPAAVPRRRVLRRPGRAAARPAAGYRRRRHLHRAAGADRGVGGGDHAATGRGRGGAAGRRDRHPDPAEDRRCGGEHEPDDPAGRHGARSVRVRRRSAGRGVRSAG